MIHILGGSVVTSSGLRRADVAVDGGLIVDVSDRLEGQPDVVIDAGGCWIGPGFVDVHVHFRDPGQTWKEDVKTGSAAAAAGGFTGLVMMPNTDPALDNAAILQKAVDRCNAVGTVEAHAAAALTLGRQGKTIVDLEALHGVGVRIFSDDGDSVMDPQLLGEIMTCLADLDGAVVSQHAEDHAVTGDGHLHAGVVSERMGLGGLPDDAEADIVARDLRLVAQTGARYHCQHVSSAKTVSLIWEAKETGLPVTAEVAPHHLTFIDEDVPEIGTNLKMYPPVRTEADRSALAEALADGTIDMVATDHAPHTADEKSVAFSAAPRGVIGLETSAAAVNAVIDDPVRFFTVMSSAGAQLAGMPDQGLTPEPGKVANLVVFDPARTWVPNSFQSRSRNSPYIGRTLTGKAVATLLRGEITHLEDRQNV